MDTARRRGEAADPERQAERVHERVLVGSGHVAAIGTLGDPVPAHRAAQRSVLRRRAGLGAIARLLFGQAQSLPVGGHARSAS